jgi:hypothetical protein
MGGNIIIGLKGIAFRDVNWIHLALDKKEWYLLVNTVMDLRFLLNVENLLTNKQTLASKELESTKSVK